MPAGEIKNNMKHDIIFAGVGGQGVVSIATMLMEAAGKEGLYAKQNEVHGMAQRGGAVSCHVRISDKPIWADIIPMGRADFILATEPMEALRYTEYLKPDGAIISANQPIKNIVYPEDEQVFNAIKSRPNSVIVDTAAITNELHNPKVANIAILGALLKRLGGRLQQNLEEGIKKRFASKGADVIETNLAALHKGMAA